MRKLLLVATVGVLAVGCKKNKEGEKASTPGTAAPKAPVSTTDQDALWALAPDGMAVGVVISPAGVGKMEAGALELQKLLAAPDLAQFKTKVDEKLFEVLGTTNPSLATAGLTAQKGFALFAPDEGPPIVILPVADRDKFLAVVKGTKGTDTDTIKNATCKTVKNVYACAKDVTLFDRLGKGSFKDQLAIAGARGDFELAGIIPQGGKQMPIAIIGQLDHGSIVLRTAIKGVPDDAKKLFVNTKVRNDGDKTAGFAMLNLPPLVAALAPQVPPLEVMPGVKLDALVKSIAGPMTITVPNSSAMFDLRMPLSDTAPSQAVIDQCPTLPPLQMLGATVTDKTCHINIPQMMMALDIWIEGKELRVGKKGGLPAAPTAPMSAVGQELASGDWMVAMYGHGTMYAVPPLPMPPLSSMPPEAALGLRAMSLVTEMGFGAKIDGDTVRMVASLRTIWSNPDDVVAKLLAIGPDQFVAGKSGAIAKAIADGSPKSPYASDYAAGYGALMMPAAMVGVMAAVSIPAFVDYTKKAKVSEASLQLNKMAKNLKIYANTNAEFPKGKTGPTPTKSCCEQGGKCTTDEATWTKDPVWSQLEFAIDEPHMFRYSYESTDGKTFTAKAIGDLDCDGVEVTYTLTGSFDQGNPSVKLDEPTNAD